jgi:hypothetical protein
MVLEFPFWEIPGLGPGCLLVYLGRGRDARSDIILPEAQRTYPVHCFRFARHPLAVHVRLVERASRKRTSGQSARLPDKFVLEPTCPG